MVPTIQSADWQREVLESDVPVMVEFFNVFCPPCRAVEPELDVLAERLGKRGKVLRIRMDANIEVSNMYGVSVGPTMILFNGGEVVERLFGPMPADELYKPFESILG